MKEIHKTVFISDDIYLQQYFCESFAFFDIETTGFSPKNSFIYLIGMAYRKDNVLHIHQFLAEHSKEESQILSAFYEKIAPFQTIFTFHGLGFDIPFLKSRENLYQLNGPWDTFDFFDLYKLTAKYSHLFHLPNKKQKTVEQFLGINREDTYSGGELITIYHNYEKTKDSHALELLLLHNYEDVLGMTKLLALFSYRDFFELPPHVHSAQLKTSHFYDSTAECNELLLEIHVPTPFPQRLLCRSDYSLLCQDTSAKILVPIYEGDLKHFYDNYKDYYYLPEEDMAIHKSVATFVDSNHRIKATAKTCYTRKSGLYLPQWESLITPDFREEKNDNHSYFLFKDELLADAAFLDTYAAHLLNHYLSSKNKLF